jgi:hypothetical protein
MKNCGKPPEASCTATLVCQKEKKNMNRRLLLLGLSVVLLGCSCHVCISTAFRTDFRSPNSDLDRGSQRLGPQSDR